MKSLGELGWQDRYEVIDGDLYCIISVWDSEKKDVDIKRRCWNSLLYGKKKKEEASDAFKEPVKHGIRRELYTAPYIWISSNYCNIKTDSNGKTSTRDKFFVNRISYTSDRKIDELEIVNQNMDVVFKQYPSQKIDDIKYSVLLEKAKRKPM